MLSLIDNNQTRRSSVRSIPLSMARRLRYILYSGEVCELKTILFATALSPDGRHVRSCGTPRPFLEGPLGRPRPERPIVPRRMLAVALLWQRPMKVTPFGRSPWFRNRPSSAKPFAPRLIWICLQEKAHGA